MDNYEETFDKAGRWGKYQLIISMTVILTSLSLPMILLILPMMQKEPVFKYNSPIGIIDILDVKSFCAETYNSYSFDEIYDKIIIEPNTIKNWASELKIVCNTRKILAIVGTVYFIASITSNLAFSKFPDRYGRRRVFLCLNLISLISLTQLLYLKHLGQLIIASFINGLGSLNLTIGSVIISETIDSKYSGLIMGITNAMFPFGGIINTIFILFLGDWRYFLVFIIIMYSIAVILGFIYMKESPKWLHANQHHTELTNTMNYIARVNGNEGRVALDRNSEELSFTHKSKSNKNIIKERYRRHVYEVLDLVKYNSIRWLTFKNLYLWLISGFSFFGLLLNLEGFTGNIFVDAIVTYSAELIAEVGSGIASHSYGRKETALFSFALAFLGSLLFVFVKVFSIQIFILFASAMGVASGFNVLYIYSAELFPTNIKSLSISVFSLFNRLAGSIIPILLTYTKNITLTISIMSLGAVFVVLSMPESLGYQAGDEVEEVQDYMYDVEEEDENNEVKENYLYFHRVFEESF